MTSIGSGERFPDLSPEELHRAQERIATAFGDAFAAVLADDEIGNEEMVEIIDVVGTAEAEIVIPRVEHERVCDAGSTVNAPRKG